MNDLCYSEMPDGLWSWLLTPPVKGGPGWVPHPLTYVTGWCSSMTSVGWGWAVVHRSGPQNAGEYWDEREQAWTQVTGDQVDAVVYRQHPGEGWQGTGTGGSENERWRCAIEKWLKTWYREVFDCPPIFKQKPKTCICKSKNLILKLKSINCFRFEKKTMYFFCVYSLKYKTLWYKENDEVIPFSLLQECRHMSMFAWMKIRKNTWRKTVVKHLQSHYPQHPVNFSHVPPGQFFFSDTDTQSHPQKALHIL